MTKVTFHTKEHEFSHGRKPKGSGSWGFNPSDPWGRVEDGAEFWCAPFGTMTQCKAAVKAAHPEWSNVSWAP